ncbi:MAG: hypothetical protein CL694_08885 [Chloroflexi bacterium]|jgi:hypothetical protein|nr:hypothetical protein [Chloroflexota bacterium]
MNTKVDKSRQRRDLDASRLTSNNVLSAGQTMHEKATVILHIANLRPSALGGKNLAPRRQMRIVLGEILRCGSGW